MDFVRRNFLVWCCVYATFLGLRDSVALPGGLSRQPYLADDLARSLFRGARDRGEAPLPLRYKAAYVPIKVGLATLFGSLGAWAYADARVSTALLVAHTLVALWGGAQFYRECERLAEAGAAQGLARVSGAPGSKE